MHLFPWRWGADGIIRRWNNPIGPIKIKTQSEQLVAPHALHGQQAEKRIHWDAFKEKNSVESKGDGQKADPLDVFQCTATAIVARLWTHKTAPIVSLYRLQQAPKLLEFHLMHLKRPTLERSSWRLHRSALLAFLPQFLAQCSPKYFRNVFHSNKFCG